MLVLVGLTAYPCCIFLTKYHIVFITWLSIMNLKYSCMTGFMVDLLYYALITCPYFSF